MRNFICKFRFYLIAVFAALIIFCAVGLCAPQVSVRAASANSDVQLIFPNTHLEYKELFMPSDVFSDDDVTAIVQNDQSLLVYYGGEYKAPLTNFDSIKQVKKADASTLLVSDNGSIYAIDLADLSKKTALVATNGNNIGGNYFDISDKYLITAFGSKGIVYERTSAGFEQKGSFALNADNPVAINADGDVFFVRDDYHLYTLSVEDLADPESYSKISDVNPSKMIADENYIYYIYDDEIYRISIASKLTTHLPVDGNLTDFDLGNLKSPGGITFKNGNLLIADGSLNAVQEFKVSASDNSSGYCLYFTGFAIASGKTAYNRISVSASDVEKYGDSVAVLDSKKLTVYSPKSADKYARENFKNYFAKDFDDQMPQAFALGNGTALLSFGHNTSSGKLALLNVVNGSVSEKITVFTGNIIRDVCYQSGYYYVLANNGALTQVYKVAESDFSFDKELFSPSLSATHISVDVFGNVYLANSVTGELVFCDRANNFAATAMGTVLGVEKLSTDLGGKLYILANGELSVLSAGAISPISILHLSDSDAVKSFAMNFDKKSVDFIYDGKEYICDCSSLNNYALSQASASDADFVISANTTKIDHLQSVTISEFANVYKVERISPEFKFIGLISPESEYAFVCDVVFDNSLVLSALAGKDGIVLVNKTELSFASPVKQAAPLKAFVTTDVCAYYFPIITDKGDVYALFDGQTIRLEKSTMIEPTAKITFLNCDFYFAKMQVGGVEYSGYIPINFTVEVLSEDFTWGNYSIERVSATTLYLELDCATEIMQLSKGKSVRLISTENGVCKVAVKLDDGSFIQGYIRAASIQDEPNRAVRNILIILAVTASVCGTMTYFVLRKKD